MTKVAFITGITGQDGSYLVDLLISKGFQPSKEFKALLHRAMDAQLEGRIASAEEGLRLLFGS